MVKPVDLQDNLSKTQLLEKVHQLQKSAPEESQKQFAQELQKKVAQNKERVDNLPKSDKITIHRDDQKQKEQRDESKKGKSKKESKKDGDDDQPRTIDYIA